MSFSPATEARWEKKYVYERGCNMNAIVCDAKWTGRIGCAFVCVSVGKLCMYWCKVLTACEYIYICYVEHQKSPAQYTHQKNSHLTCLECCKPKKNTNCRSCAIIITTATLLCAPRVASLSLSSDRVRSPGFFRMRTQFAYAAYIMIIACDMQAVNFKFPGNYNPLT